jgi:hypothetical protein
MTYKGIQLFMIFLYLFSPAGNSWQATPESNSFCPAGSQLFFGCRRLRQQASCRHKTHAGTNATTILLAPPVGSTPKEKEIDPRNQSGIVCHLA